MKNIAAVILITLLLPMPQQACTHPVAAVNPPGYDLDKPQIYIMPSILEEISGISFSQGDAAVIYAEQDEEGKLFYLSWGETTPKHTKFSKRGDYEDLAICNGMVIMLRSDGVFFTFPLSGMAKEAEGVNEQDGLLPPGEFESLYADEAGSTLYALCKNCSGDKSAGVVSGFVFNLAANGQLSKKTGFSIDEKAIPIPGTKDKFKLKASALAKNPVTRQWYILSSVNKLLVIADDQWKPIHAYPLNGKLFTQPEGIAFDKAGTLYISNEKGSAENGTILKFLYHSR